MFITTNKKLGFIHIPKCGGTSIHAAFRGGVKGPNKNNHQDPWSLWQPADSHITYEHMLRDYPNLVHPETWFTVVRNPFARYQSWYYYQIAYHKKRLSGELKLKGHTPAEMREHIAILEDLGIKGTLLNLDWVVAQGVPKQFSKPQYDWVSGCPNLKWFKLEEIDTLYKWLDNMGCHKERMHEKKIDKKLTWQEELDDEMLEVIQQRYAIDFEKFGYELIL